jgi:hypothetical protein
VGRVYVNWARGKQLDPEAGALGLKQALESYLALGNKSSAPSFYGLLSELEAMRQDLNCALTTIDAGLAMAEETGEHYTDSYLHRLRGEFLLLRCPSAPAPAEEAFQIAIAKAQGARGYTLLAFHSLAKLYLSTGRPAAAYAFLGPALKGFSPTPGDARDRRGAGADGAFAVAPVWAVRRTSALAVQRRLLPGLRSFPRRPVYARYPPKD